LKKLLLIKINICIENPTKNPGTTVNPRKYAIFLLIKIKLLTDKIINKNPPY